MSVVSGAIKMAQTTMQSVLDNIVGVESAKVSKTPIDTNEQLRRYYAMKPQHFEAIRAKHGESGLQSYIDAMEKLAREGM